jgi:hypothetical protein
MLPCYNLLPAGLDLATASRIINRIVFRALTIVYLLMDTQQPESHNGTEYYLS